MSKQLKKLAELRRNIYSQSLKDKLTRENYQIDLKELYKPLLTGQEAQLKKTSEISDKTSEISDKTSELLTESQQKEQLIERQHNKLIEEIRAQPLLIPLIKSLNKFPNVIKVIKGEMNADDLNNQELAILKELKLIKDDDILKILIDYYVKIPEEKRERVISESKIPSPSKMSPKSQASSSQATAKEEISENDLTIHGYNIYNNLTKIKTSDPDFYLIVGTIMNPEAVIAGKWTPEKLLERYIQIDKIRPDGRVKFWQYIYDKFPDFNKKPYGTGIKFLTSDSKELLNKLEILIAEKSAGNSNPNIFNEISAIVDELRRQGVLTLKQIKKIYKFL